MHRSHSSEREGVMGKQIDVLTDGRIGRRVTLQLPQLNYRAVSPQQGMLRVQEAEEFCGLYEKIWTTSAIFEGIIRIDFSAPRIGRREHWNYKGVTRYRHPKADQLEPLCLVVLQSLIGTPCAVRTQGGKKQLVVTEPHIALYAKSAPLREPGGPLPVPHLPEAARQGYACIYESDVKEVTVAMDGTMTITEIGQ